MKRTLTVGPKCVGPVRGWIGYLRPDQILDHLTVIKIPSKLEVAPLYGKMSEWVSGYPLDCYDY